QRTWRWRGRLPSARRGPRRAAPCRLAVSHWVVVFCGWLRFAQQIRAGIVDRWRLGDSPWQAAKMPLVRRRVSFLRALRVCPFLSGPLDSRFCRLPLFAAKDAAAMLLPCPYCDHEVIEGADSCDSCGQPLTESHLPVPASAVERALLTDRVKLFQGRQPLVVPSTTPVREVLRLLADNKVGCLLVAEHGKTVGIFTE